MYQINLFINCCRCLIMTDQSKTLFMQQVQDFSKLNTFGNEEESPRDDTQIPQSSFSVKADLLLQIHALNHKIIGTLKFMIKPQPALQNVCMALASLVCSDMKLDIYALSNQSNWTKVQQVVGDAKSFQEKLTSFVYCPNLDNFEGVFDQCLKRITILQANFTHSSEQGNLFEHLKHLTEMFDRYREVLVSEQQQKQDQSSQYINPNQLVDEKRDSNEEKIGRSNKTTERSNKPIVPSIHTTLKKKKLAFEVEKATPVNERSRLSTTRSSKANADPVVPFRAITKAYLERPNHTGYYENPTISARVKIPADGYRRIEQCDEKPSEEPQLERELSVKLLQFLQSDPTPETPPKPMQPEILDYEPASQTQTIVQKEIKQKKPSLNLCLTPSSNVRPRFSPLPSRLSYNFRHKEEDPMEQELKQQIKQNQKEIQEMQWEQNRLKWEIERESKQLLQLAESRKEREVLLQRRVDTEQSEYEVRMHELQMQRERSQENQQYRKNYKVISNTDSRDYFKVKQKLLEEGGVKPNKNVGLALRLYTEPSESQQSTVLHESEVNHKMDPTLQRLREKAIETQRQKEWLQQEHQRSVRSVNQYINTTPFKWAVSDHKFVFKHYQ